MGKIDPYGDPRPSYRQVADDVAARIDSGEIIHRLPGERALAQEYEVAVQTVRHSMEILRDEGRIITRQGRGSFVDPPPPSDDADSP